MTMTLDHLDQQAAAVFDGYLVRKDLVRKYARQYPVPTYVVEFLLGRYCASTDEKEIAEGLRSSRSSSATARCARARRSSSRRAPRRRQRQAHRHHQARLDAKNDCYLAELPSLALRDVLIDDQLVRDNERMLTDGFYAEVTLAYDGVALRSREADRSPSSRCARSRCRSRTCSMCWPRRGAPSRRRSGSTS
jgi:ATP-dependent Lon protease